MKGDGTQVICTRSCLIQRIDKYETELVANRTRVKNGIRCDPMTWLNLALRIEKAFAVNPVVASMLPGNSLELAIIPLVHLNARNWILLRMDILRQSRSLRRGGRHLGERDLSADPCLCPSILTHRHVVGALSRHRRKRRHGRKGVSRMQGEIAADF